MRIRLLAALVAALPACVPPAVAQEPPEPRIVVVGDSVTEQAYSYLGGWQDPPGDVVKVAGSGWSMANATGPYMQAIQDGVDATVLALGPNDANPASGGWDLADIARWSDFLNTTVPDGTCVVVELPRHKSGFPTAWAAELNEARDWIIDLTSPGGQFPAPSGVHVVLEDWRMRTAPHPELLAGDGIHLSGSQAAGERQDDYWDGARRCPTGGS